MRRLRDAGTLALSVLLALSLGLTEFTQASILNIMYVQASPVRAEEPRVRLEAGTAGTSIISMNGTSASVRVAPPPTPFYYPSGYNIVAGTYISGSLPTSVQTVDDDYFIAGSTVSATSTIQHHPSSYNLLGSTTHISGSLANLQSNDGDYMTFRSYSTTIDDLEDFVDQQSNIDGSGDIGTHSNFTAIRAGPDGIYDVLTEQRIVSEAVSSKTNALIAYRSNTGTNGPSSPKCRIWTGDLASWNGEIELPSAGSPVRWVRTEYCPVQSRGYEVIVMTISDDQYYDLYIWNGTQWLVFNNIGYHASTTFYRGFDVAYEHASGRALIVYSRGTSADGQEIGYRIWDGKTLSQEYLLGSPTTGIIYWINLASCPGTRPGTADDNEIAMILIDSNRNIYGYVWTGSAWHTMGQTTIWDSAAAIATEECIAVAYEQLSGRAMFIWGSATFRNNYYRIWNGLTLTSNTLLRISAQGGVTNWITLKPRPNSNGLLLTVLDAGSDLNTAYWNGNTWTVHTEHDAACDTHASRCVDFAWSPAGNTGLLVWGTSLNSISYRIFTPPDTWSNINTTAASGTHPWVQLRTNPRYVDGDKYVLGADLNSDFDIGSIWWDGVTFSITEGVITTDTTLSTYECFEIAFMNFGPITITYQLDLEVQWVSIDHMKINEYLCIYAGALDPENLMVEVWTGYTWVTIINALGAGWNNVSVSAYLTSSTFTIRFRDAVTSNDAAQSSWGIDCVLLHMWDTLYVAEVEFTGASDPPPWIQFTWTVDSCLTDAGVNVTLQLFDYKAGQYPMSGDGYISYVSSDTPNTDETISRTITANPERFRDSSGNWKIRVRCEKRNSAQFDLKLDWIMLEASVPSQYRASVEFLFAEMPMDAAAQLNITIVSHCNVTDVDVTVQLWNYDLNSYAESGEGFLQYLSGGVNETRILTIALNPESYMRNGEARIKVTAVKDSTSPFQHEINKLEIYFCAFKYDYVLQVHNQVSEGWRIRLRAYDQSNITRLSNSTIYFHAFGGESSQIVIINGEYSRQQGDWYNLTGLGVVYIAMAVSVLDNGTSRIYTYLEVNAPGTTVYNLLAIEFEIS